MVNKHILGHHDYIEGRSYLLDGINPQDLVYKYAGTGEIRRNRNGDWHRNQEKITVDDFIGVNIDIDDKEWKGKVMSVDLAVNYDDIEYDELDLKIDGRDGVVAFPENEIISIEII